MARIFIEGNHACLPDSEEYKMAEELGHKLAGHGFTIVSSARKGIAEAAFKGASMADDNSTRIAIDCAEINLPRNSRYTKEVIADNYFDMKMRNCVNSDAFVFLSGSFSVLSNLAIVLQLKQLELMGRKPIVCIGDQITEMLNTFSFYNEESLEMISSITPTKNVEEAVNILVKHFTK